MEFSRPEGPLSTDPTLWLYTSLSSGSSTIVTATARMETILKANRVPFKALDVATEDKARMLWGRRAGKRKLPGLVKQGLVLADLTEVEEWNEYGEVRENLLDEEETKPAPATPAAATAAAAARPTAPTPFSAATHNASAASSAAVTPVKPLLADLKSGSASLKSIDSAGRKSTDSTSSKNPEAERQQNMLSLAEQVAAKAKKSSALRTASGTVLSRSSLDSASSKTTAKAKEDEGYSKPAATAEAASSDTAKEAEAVDASSVKKANVVVPVTKQEDKPKAAAKKESSEKESDEDEDDDDDDDDDGDEEDDDEEDEEDEDEDEDESSDEDDSEEEKKPAAAASKAPGAAETISTKPQVTANDEAEKPAAAPAAAAAAATGKSTESAAGKKTQEQELQHTPKKQQRTEVVLPGNMLLGSVSPRSEHAKRGFEGSYPNSPTSSTDQRYYANTAAATAGSPRARKLIMDENGEIREEHTEVTTEDADGEADAFVTAFNSPVSPDAAGRRAKAEESGLGFDPLIDQINAELGEHTEHPDDEGNDFDDVLSGLERDQSLHQQGENGQRQAADKFGASGSGAATQNLRNQNSTVESQSDSYGLGEKKVIRLPADAHNDDAASPGCFASLFSCFGSKKAKEKHA